MNRELGNIIYCIVCDTNFEYDGVEIIGYMKDKKEAEKYCIIQNDVYREHYYVIPINVLHISDIPDINKIHINYIIKYFNNAKEPEIVYTYTKHSQDNFRFEVSYKDEAFTIKIENNYNRNVINKISDYIINKYKEFYRIAKNNDIAIELINGIKNEITNYVEKNFLDKEDNLFKKLINDKIKKE